LTNVISLAAYFRSGGTTQPSGGGIVQEYGGKLYVVLSNVRDTLAVYRQRVGNKITFCRSKIWRRCRGHGIAAPARRRDCKEGVDS
jgi:hypothetical protein